MLFDEVFLRRLENLRLAVRRAVSGRREGDRLTRKRGGSAEFHAHRPYTQGDEFRSIDWNLYGRLGQLYVKEFTREEALPVRLAIDTSVSMTPKFDFARQLGAALAVVANRESMAMPLAKIEALRAGDPFTVPSLGRGLLLVISDLWDDDLRVALLKIRAEIAVIHVLSPEEVEPSLEGKHKLVDSETGETRVRFIGTEEKEAYRKLLAEHCAGWKRWCFDREINYLRCASDGSLEDIVGIYLREAGVLE